MAIMCINNHFIDEENPFFIVKEGSANNGVFKIAFQLIDFAAKSDADTI